MVLSVVLKYMHQQWTTMNPNMVSLKLGLLSALTFLFTVGDSVSPY